MKLLGTILLAAAATGFGDRGDTAAFHDASRANFVQILVTAPRPTKVHAVWHPYAGAIGSGDAQQAALRQRWILRNDPDSVRRWADTTARDTIVSVTPAAFVVDMNGGPVLVESIGRDSIHVEAQLTPRRGPTAAAWGRTIIINSDGRQPSLIRRR